MRTIISGPVTEQHLADADFLIGIIPTSFVTNGLFTPPANSLETEVMPVCRMMPIEMAEKARNYTLCGHDAEALICVGENEHLVNLARSYGLHVYHVED